MRDELLNETLFLTIGLARSILARWVKDYNNERPQCSLNYATRPHSLLGSNSNGLG